jgi:hypothetical protein
MDKYHYTEGQNTRTTIAHKREWNPNCGNHAQRHSDIDKKMDKN